VGGQQPGQIFGFHPPMWRGGDKACGVVSRARQKASSALSASWKVSSLAGGGPPL